MQATLFDTCDPPPPRQPAEPWLVKELVALGVARATAEGYSMRQAFGVRARLARAGGTKTKQDAPQIARDGPDALPRGRAVSALERTAIADELEAIVSESRAGTATGDEVYRCLRASLFVLTGPELERVCMGLVSLLRRADRGAVL